MMLADVQVKKEKSPLEAIEKEEDNSSTGDKTSKQGHIINKRVEFWYRFLLFGW